MAKPFTFSNGVHENKASYEILYPLTNWTFGREAWDIWCRLPQSVLYFRD